MAFVTPAQCTPTAALWRDMLMLSAYEMPPPLWFVGLLSPADRLRKLMSTAPPRLTGKQLARAKAHHLFARNNFAHCRRPPSHHRSSPLRNSLKLAKIDEEPKLKRRSVLGGAEAARVLTTLLACQNSTEAVGNVKSASISWPLETVLKARDIETVVRQAVQAQAARKRRRKLVSRVKAIGPRLRLRK